MPTNVLLVRWHGGWHERPLPNTDLEDMVPRRIEAALGLGAAQSVQEVDRIADQQLDIFRTARVAIAAEIAPEAFPVDESRTPYLGFLVGDVVGVEEDQERVVAVTVSEDEQGAVSYSTDWRSLVAEGTDAFAQWLKKMANGTLAGQSRPATPISQVSGAAGPSCCLPEVTPGG